MRIFLNLFFLFIFCSHTQAQNYERALEICERYYEEGNYKKAFEKCDATIQQLNKRRIGLAVAKANLYKAKYLEALGEYGEFESIISVTLKKKAYKGKHNTLYGKAVLDAAYLYLLYSDIKTAESFLKSARDILAPDGGELDKDGNNWDNYFTSQMTFIETSIHIERGNFAEAEKLIPELLEAKKRRIVSKEKYYNEVSNRFEERKLDPFKERRRKREYAEVMTLAGDLQRRIGNYDKANQLLTEASIWIKTHLNNKDLAYIKNQQAIALLMIDREDDETEIRKSLEKNIFLAERRLGLVHKTFLEIHETLIDHYINIHNGKSRVQQWEFRTNTSKYFGKDKTQHGISVRLDAKKDYYNQNYEASLNDLKVLYETEGKIPANHKEKVNLLEQLYDVSIANEKYDEAYFYLEKQLETVEGIYGEESLKYQYTVMDLADYYLNYTNKFELVDSLIDKTFYGVISDKISENHVDYGKFLNQYAGFYELIGQYEKARNLIEKYVGINEGKFGKSHINYAISLERLIDLDLKVGDFKEADKNINLMLEIFKNEYNRKTKTYEYSQALETSARYYAMMGLFDQAQSFLSKSSKLYNKSINAKANSSAVDELAYLYIKTERFKQTEEMLNEALQVRLERYGDSSRFLITPYNQLARLAQIHGEYVEAEELVNKAQKIAENIFGDSSFQVTESLLIKAVIDNAIGDYEGAEENIKRVIGIEEKLFGKHHIELANSYTQLALTKFYNGEELDEIEKLLERSNKIIADNLGENNPIYAESLKNLALVNTENEKLELAFSRLKTADNIWKQKLGTSLNINSAEIEMLIGDIEIKREDFKGAKEYFEDSRKSFSKIFNTEHPSYIKSTAKLGRSYYLLDDFKKSKKYTNEVLKKYRNNIHEFFPALSEREKAKYWQLMKHDYDFYSNLVFSQSEKRKGKKLIGQVYNNTLETKSLLLSSSIKVRNQILNSNDSTLIKNYESWIDKKEDLTKALAMNNDQLKEGSIDIKHLVKEIEDVEKELSAKSGFFEKKKKETTWEDVKKALKPGEAAVEIIRHHYFDKSFTDSVVYSALIITPKSKRPELISLPNSNLLETNYLRYYRYCIIYNIKDENSYTNYWKPIHDALPESSKIYLSSEGVFNQINLEAMVHEDGNFVIDHNNIVLVSNTRDLVKEEESTVDNVQSKEVALFGNPVFYKDLKEEEFDIYNDRKISQLPGTMVEVKKLEEFLRSDAGEVPVSYMHKQATEERVKELKSPKIFHIATHGFFLPDTEDNKENILDNQKVVNNPLLRSGLLLKNAGDLMEDGNVYSFNKENGVLTAYEAMSLNLDNTELVILSACETGRGENKVGEGVYGLQRALLVAGTNSIIMSLFKVSDEATQKLMLYFYKNWLEKKMDKRTAFIEAKKELRKEYKDPIFWAAFIMIGSV
ncbi:CHAT domain-containing protein [Flexithrix dorotheae]|uniref:CHAT domain-containing protein n=1 Tax=Flexithrix dorotheae TaxID=70993 RepID=UPI00039CF2B7|nr:CHAT domain-containing protein [Flexithrix dorotheae]